MKYKAHDYQQYATDFIIGHPVSCLILDMGLGKTVITLTALWLLLFDYFEVRRILVIAPKRVAETTWPAEIKKWEHLYGMTFAVAMGTAGQRKEALLSGADVTIIGRNNVSWMTKNIFFDFDMAVMEEIGLPYAYHHFAEGESPDPPFAVFLYPGSNNFSADGKVYFKTDRLNIEIYTDIKNIELEQQTEAVLDGHDIFYEKSEVWIESENLYEVLYQMEV